MKLTRGTAAAKTFNFAYNNIYELTAVTGGQTHSYAYDNTANRKTADGTSYTANNLNQYTAVGAQAYQYNANGNLTNDGKNAYVYDEANRLSSMTNSTSTAGYEYDGFDRRVAKTVNGTKTYFVSDGDQEIEERSSTGTLNADYVYGTGIDEVLTMTRGGTTYYYHYDGLGSVTDLTSSTGTVVESYDYDAYGTPSKASTVGNPYFFTGRRLDAESGIYYYRARMYNPAIGRFLQRDPIGYYDSMNLYQYGLNNPLRWTDPKGLDLMILHDPNGARVLGFPFGHQAIAIGNDHTGWSYYSQDGPDNGGGHAKEYQTWQDVLGDPENSRYQDVYYIPTSPEQDDKMKQYVGQNLDRPYSANPFNPKRYQCGDFVDGTLGAGEIPTGDIPFGNPPNSGYPNIEKANPQGHPVKGS